MGSPALGHIPNRNTDTSLSPTGQKRKDKALLRNTWITWNLPDMEAALVGCVVLELSLDMACELCTPPEAPTSTLALANIAGITTANEAQGSLTSP
ncbi:hypothetical protein DUI87_17274 [Hirundo rustica rustica]|uniref:Uncharacterized protein n=1 Tax=Hirundo rustica rustica TaxID=333673 RepID=A0A3M0JZY9_HIRRU|nr:hypothetical protein DUI87_17274 [Hirundo rustica rustica]